MRGEDRLFVPGEPHSRCFEINGHRIGLIICVETAHEPWAYLKSTDHADTILWPGFYGPTLGETWSDAQAPDDLKVRSNHAHWKLPLLQATCASSPEDHYWPDKRFGGSPIIDSDGKEVFSGRPSTEDLMLVEIAENRVYSARSLTFPTYWKSMRSGRS